MKVDSPEGWGRIFANFVTSHTASAFYPVMTSFEDWGADYGIKSHFMKFHPQRETILEYFAGRKQLALAGGAIYQTRANNSGRWLFGDQMHRVSGYRDAEMKAMLYDMAALGGAIPVSGWESSYVYGEKVKAFCSDYPNYLRTTYLLPPRWYLMDTLPETTWLKCLVASGVLEDGLLRTSRGVRCIARDGHECNSLAEMEIDNWLHMQGVTHEREPAYPVHPKYNSNGMLRADFRVGGFLIEYAGLLDDPVYAEKMEKKKLLAIEIGVQLITLTPNDLSRLERVLQAPLHDFERGSGTVGV